MARPTSDDHSRSRSETPTWALRVGVCLAVAALAGCSGRGTYITGGPSTGQLKSSLSRMEFENDQLKTQVARLKEENRQFEDRLVQEQLHNGEITARLDDMRNALRDRGYDDFDSDRDAPATRQPRTLPAGRTTPPKRKAPAAQISRASESEEIPPIRIEDPPRSERSSSSTSRKSRSSAYGSDPGEDLGLDEKGMRWTPIAQGAAVEGAPKR